MTLEEMGERIERLERGNRHLAGAACLLALGALAAVGWARGATSPGTVDARRIILRDGRGRIQGDLRASVGRPGLTLVDSEGVERLRLCCSDDGSTALSITTGRDSGTRRSIDLRAASDGWSALSLLDEKDVERLAIGLAYDGEPRLRMFTPGGKPRISIGSDTSGRAEVVIHDGGGTERGVLRAAPGGSTSLSLYDAEGTAVFTAPPAGSPQKARRIQTAAAGSER
jgi:hypothetical protein